MKITVCIGSSCHLRGSREVISKLNSLIAENNLENKVELGGIFCLGNCGGNGVSVKIDDTPFSVTLDEIETFFDEEVLQKIEP